VELGHRSPNFPRELAEGIGCALRLDAATNGALNDVTAVHEIAPSRMAITSLRNALPLQTVTISLTWAGLSLASRMLPVCGFKNKKLGTYTPKLSLGHAHRKQCRRELR